MFNIIILTTTGQLNEHVGTFLSIFNDDAPNLLKIQNK